MMVLDCNQIVITIHTPTPAADASRYIVAIFNALKGLQKLDYPAYHEDCFALLQLLEHIHPPPKESDFAFSIPFAQAAL